MSTPQLQDLSKQIEQAKLDANELLLRAKAALQDPQIGIVAKLEASLDAANAELHITETVCTMAEELLKRAKASGKLDEALEQAKSLALVADIATIAVEELVKPVHDIVKAEEAKPKEPILNIREIKELKEFREIVNIEGEAAERAKAAHDVVASLETLQRQSQPAPGEISFANSYNAHKTLFAKWHLSDESPSYFTNSVKENRKQIFAELSAQELGQYGQSNSGSLARGIYSKTYEQLDSAIQSLQPECTPVDVDTLGKLLFYADCISRPNQTALALLQLQDFLHKIALYLRSNDIPNSEAIIAKLYSQIGASSLYYIFSEAEIAQWDSQKLQRALDTICQTVEARGWNTSWTQELIAIKDEAGTHNLQSYDSLKHELTQNIYRTV